MLGLGNAVLAPLKDPPPALLASLGPNVNHRCEYAMVNLLMGGSACCLCGARSAYSVECPA